MTEPITTKLRSLAGALIERLQFSRYAGLTFGGKRDMYSALGYQGTLLQNDYRSRYERDGIAAKCVDSLPKAVWRGTGELVESEDASTRTQFEEEWLRLADRLHVWNIFLRAHILASLGEYAVILIGAPGTLNTPLAPGNPDSIAYLRTYPQNNTTIQEYVTDSADPRFGQPSLYQLGRVNAPSLSPTPGLKGSWQVHYSRIVHIAVNPLDEDVIGMPVLQRVWNLFDCLEKVTGGGAEAFWMRAHQGYQLNLDKDLSQMEIKAEADSALSAEVDEFVHGMRRVVRTRGMDMKALGSDVADFSKPADAIITQIAGALGIPKRILVGSEAGELASTQDRDNWKDQITDCRTGWAEPMVVRPFADRLIALNYLPQPASYTVRWPDIQFLNDTERAAIANTLADTNAKMGQTVVTADEIRDRVLNLPPLDMVDEPLVAPLDEGVA